MLTVLDQRFRADISRRLGLIDQEAVNQPVAERRRLEPVNLESIANRNLRAKAAIGRAK
jgi:hypothetical protein